MTSTHLPPASAERSVLEAQVPSHDERMARVTWSLMAHSTDAAAHRLVHHHGAIEALEMVRSGVVPELDAYAHRLQEVDPERCLRLAEHAGVHLIVPGDTQWPDDLNTVEPPPMVLWVRGTLRRDHHPGLVAIVGARACTSYGAYAANDLAAEVAEAGWGVVSGAAFGIDAAAHRGALAVGGYTVAVLAGGVDQPYPRAHEGLLREIAATGAVISEFPPGQAPTRYRFLHRNRLIAALGRGTVVVESGLRSGAHNTAGTAHKLNRVVAAFPGPVTSPSSAGCHQLIRDGMATLVTGSQDVIELLAPVGSGLADALFPGEEVLTPQDRMVWDVLPLRGWSEPSRIAASAGVELDLVVKSLARLLLLGVAERQADTWRKAT